MQNGECRMQTPCPYERTGQMASPSTPPEFCILNSEFHSPSQILALRCAEVGIDPNGLLGKRLVLSEPAFDTAWYKDIQEGRLAAFVGAVWASALIQKNAPGAAGKWAVAPMPQWTAGGKAAGNRGGSATAVLKGCKNPKEATEAAVALSTDNDVVTSLIQNTGIYPAAISGQELPALDQPSDYFGGKNIYPVFKEAAANIAPGWMWGPTMSQAQPAFKDGLKKVGSGQGTVAQLVTSVQTSTVNDMKAQGLSVVN